PVGLIMSAWGGTSIEIWMRQSLMEKNPDTAPIVKRWKKSPVFDWKRWNDGRGMAYDIALSNVRFVSKNRGIRTLYLNEGGLGGNWESNAAEGSSISCKGDGKKGRVSGIIAFNSWANAETRLSESGEYDLSGYDEIRFTASGSGRFSVSLGQKSIKDYDYYSSETFDAVLKPEKEYAVRIDSMKQGGWGRAVPFTKNAVEKFKVNIHSTTVELPQSLYNGMVSPFTRYKIKGALWYQGENNAWRAKQYRSLIKMLIRGWRQDWGYEFPFFVVQLPNFMERKDAPGESAWAELREAQLSALELENTAVVPIIDLGDADDIHPRKKDPVAGRLSNAALVMLYNKKAPVTGPLYDSHRQSRRGITVTFKNTGSGLVARGGRLKGFEIAGEDRVFVRARAEIKNSNSVEVSAREVKNPVAVRYAWADNPECNLYNMEGLAASPFRTDKWPGITENNY
ncbi:MAG TPA: sialate O-acetylesterase, partial [Candidatus Goldiibacteriota bacterium]|nr:sialate O-acetylesterase [Candidatus Goldiibacteriota bacterium]